MIPLPSKVWLLGGAAAVLVLTSGLIGYRLGDAKTDRLITRIQNNTILRTQRAQVIAEKVGADTAAREAQVRYVTRTITERVKEYVPVQADAKCDVPAGFVSVFNAAAQGVQLPSGPAQSADTPSGVALSTVADTTVHDFGICRETAERLTGWQTWYAQVRAMADAK